MDQIFYGDVPVLSLSTHRDAVNHLVHELRNQEPGFIRDIFAPVDIFSSLKKWSQSWVRSLRYVLILGTGGSSLGGQALYQALGQDNNGPQLIFLDNIDPHVLQRTLQPLAISKTGVVVISKSGKTLETMAQLLACWEVWQHETALFKPEHFFVVVTDPSPSPLRHFAETKKLTLWNHPAHTGGRFSVWSVVGALPSFCKNIPFEAFREGAQSMIDSFITSPEYHPVTQGALWHSTHHCSQHVMMPYHNDLVAFSMWHRQLWAESLGKEGQGSTPVCALGTVDQHSQLQLYLEGPMDKAYTFLVYDETQKDSEDTMSSWSLMCELDNKTPEWRVLEGLTLNQILHAEQKATRMTVCSTNQPVREWVISCGNAFDFGALMAHCVLEVLLLAQLRQVNPYDQPAVEMIKRKTQELLLSVKSDA